MLFNINDYVRVRLTEHGKQIHKEHWDEIFANTDQEYIPPKEDQDGWSKWQLWSLISEFGEHFHMGCDMPFETEIDIVEK